LVKPSFSALYEAGPPLNHPITFLKKGMYITTSAAAPKPYIFLSLGASGPPENTDEQ
jgi:hypothetical protein